MSLREKVRRVCRLVALVCVKVCGVFEDLVEHLHKGLLQCRAGGVVWRESLGRASPCFPAWGMWRVASGGETCLLWSMLTPSVLSPQS